MGLAELVFATKAAISEHDSLNLSGPVEVILKINEGGRFNTTLHVSSHRRSKVDVRGVDLSLLVALCGVSLSFLLGEVEVEFRVGHSLGEDRSKGVVESLRHDRSSHTHNSIDFRSKADRVVHGFLSVGNEEFKVIGAPRGGHADLVLPGVALESNRSVSTFLNSRVSTLGARLDRVEGVTLADAPDSTVFAFHY